MRRLQAYIFRRTALVFVGVLMTLTGIVWVTQALRRFDLVTAKGQAILVYLGMTLLAVPSLMSIVAPFALVIAMAVVLNSLHADSELVAANAAGASHRHILLPFLVLGGFVSLLVGMIDFQSGPAALRMLRDMTNAVRADIVANVVQPGRFVEIDDDFTFHIRNRAGDGSLEGIFIFDARSPEYVFTYSAEHGRVTEILDRPLVIMERGTVERMRRSDGTSTFVAFGSYGFDLSELAPEDQGTRYRPNELTFLTLIGLSPDDPLAEGRLDQIAAEIRNRIATAIYPIAMVLPLFLFFGFTKNTRSQRTSALIGGLIVATLVRLVGFAAVGIASSEGSLAFAVIALPVGMVMILGASVAAGIEPFVPKVLADTVSAAFKGLPRSGAKGRPS